MRVLSVVFVVCSLVCGACPLAGAQEAVQEPGRVPDTIVTCRGERIRCKVAPAAEVDRIVFSTPWLEGVAHAPLSALRSVHLGEARTEELGVLRAELRNGDWVCGVPRTLDDRALVLETSFAGAVKVERSALAVLHRTHAPDLVKREDFSSPDLAGWKQQRGEWMVVDGRARPVTASDPRNREFRTLQLPIEHAAPFTLEVDVRRANPCHVMFEVGVLLDRADLSAVSNALTVRVEDGELRLQKYTSSTGSKPVERAHIKDHKRLFGTRRPTRLRIGMRPAGKEMVIWINGKERLRAGIPDYREQPREGLVTDSGATIILRSVYGESFDRFRLYNGFLDPADSAPEPRDDVDTLVLANGDTLAGRVLGLEGGKWTVEVEGVELAVDGQNLAHLVLRSRAATAGAPPDALRVHTGTSGLTLRSVSLQGERVTGESPWGGKIAIDRQFVHRLTSLSEAAKTPEPNEGASGH